MKIILKPIGTVHSPLKARERRDASKIVSEIILDTELTEGLDNLNEFSYITIIYFMHKSHKPAPLKIHPKIRKDPTPVGVFASRSPDRPNALGKTTVKLLEHRDNILKVQGLDAIDGTPVIDIKPYIPDIDAPPEAKVPPWMTSQG